MDARAGPREHPQKANKQLIINKMQDFLVIKELSISIYLYPCLLRRSSLSEAQDLDHFDRAPRKKTQ
jgi:hypothetical protein